MHKIVAIGCGPGDPDLLTVKAVKEIKNADIILCPASKQSRPSIVLSIITPIIEELEKKPEIVRLIFPMTKDVDTLHESWKKNADEMAKYAISGKKVVYVTVGDPYLYSTWIYMHRELESRYPDVMVDVVPGLVSIFTFTSKVGISLAEGAEKFTVVPSCYDLSQVKELARNSDTMVFLKDGRYFDQVIEILREVGFSDKSQMAIGQDLDTKNEFIKKLTLGEVTKGMTSNYFSIMVIKRNG